MSINYDPAENRKLRGLVETLRTENAALKAALSCASRDERIAMLVADLAGTAHQLEVHQAVVQDQQERIAWLEKVLLRGLSWTPARSFEADSEGWTRTECYLHAYRAAWNEVKDVLSALAPSPGAEAKEENPPNTWYCGCGHFNGYNLATCAACTRPPGGLPGESKPAPSVKAEEKSFPCCLCPDKHYPECPRAAKPAPSEPAREEPLRFFSPACLDGKLCTDPKCACRRTP